MTAMQMIYLDDSVSSEKSFESRFSKRKIAVKQQYVTYLLGVNQLSISFLKKEIHTWLK